MILELLLFVGVLLLVMLHKVSSKPSSMPPGSFGLPVVGSLPARNKHITHHLRDLKDKYGNIYTTKWGSIIIVVLADFHMIKNAMNHADFQGRPHFFSFDLFNNFMNIGIISSDDKIWNENRRFLLRHLRDLGMGKTRLEASIQDEAEMLVQYLEENSLDDPTEIGWSVDIAVINVLWQMLASRRYETDDEEGIELCRIMGEDADIVQGPVFLLDAMPWLEKVVPNFLKNNIMKIDVMIKHRDNFQIIARRIIKEHKDTLDPDNPRDVLDFYLIEIQAQKDDPETTFTSDYDNLVALMGDMFFAGFETTSSTLRWMILHMAIHPEIQQKIHHLLDRVVPKERLPSLDDRKELAYIDAVLLDIFRLSSLAPLSLPHRATASVKFEGYTIPKDTILLPCLELCHRDPALWEHPDQLHPEHFLDQDGKLNSKREGFLPFNIGRRQCLGESLARMELFLFASAILQRFTIEAPPGVTLTAETDPDKKLLNTPKPFKVILRRRD